MDPLLAHAHPGISTVNRSTRQPLVGKLKRALLALAVSTGAVGALTWSPASLACAVEPFMASVCIMAWPRNVNFGGDLYTTAAGQTLQVASFQALYSIIGTTYGGSTQQGNFKLPDLRGRVVVGVGQSPGLPAYNYGNTGGAVGVVLSVSQLPSHNHALGTSVTTNTNMANVTVETTSGTLAVTTTAGTLAASSSISGLTATLKASTASNTSSDPTGMALSTPNSPTRYYATTAPSVNMNAGSIALGGSVTTTLSGAPSSTLSGAPSTTLSGTPSVTVGGVTEATGGGTGIPTMPPYAALVYYIAIGGIYPTPD